MFTNITGLTYNLDLSIQEGARAKMSDSLRYRNIGYPCECMSKNNKEQ